jgi:hypothetical protein
MQQGFESRFQIDGIPVTAVRRRAKRIIIRVKADGSVWLTVPLRRATLAEAEAFLRSKMDWVLRTREKILARPVPAEREFTPVEMAALQTLLGELHPLWAARLGEFGVQWKLRRMKTRWGVCNYVKRRVTYSAMLAGRSREFVEYVVVHELTHLKAHGHGADFKALMDARLPDWRIRRRMAR